MSLAPNVETGRRSPSCGGGGLLTEACSALVAVQAATSGPDLVVDGRLAGLPVAALALRAPFIVVLLLAGATGALVHVVAG